MSISFQLLLYIMQYTSQEDQQLFNFSLNFCGVIWKSAIELSDYKLSNKLSEDNLASELEHNRS